MPCGTGIGAGDSSGGAHWKISTVGSGLSLLCSMVHEEEGVELFLSWAVGLLPRIITAASVTSEEFSSAL